MLIDNKIKDHKSLGEWAKVYQIQFNSSNYVQKTWTHKCNIWPNSYCVKKKGGEDLGVWAAFKLNMSQQYYSFPLELKKSKVAFTKNDT